MATNRKRRKYNSIGEKEMQSSKPIKNPRKQRKILLNAPAHKRHKLMAAPLSPELTAQKGIKTLPVRKGDSVRVMRGDHKGFEGKVSRIDLKKYRIYIEGLTREKVDGSTIFVPLHPSKIMIRNLNLDDKIRKAVLERKKLVTKKAEKPAKKMVDQEKANKKKATTASPTTATTETLSETSSAAISQVEQKVAAKSQTPNAEGGT